MSTVVEAAKPKDKTKAKKRYLKKKKENRKKNKQVKRAGPLQTDLTVPQESDVSEDDSEDEGDAEDIVMDASIADAKEAPVNPPPKPPKKRRKLEAPLPESNEDDMVVDLPEAPSIPIGVDIPAGTLPSFPLPVHPNLPSRSDLALQGLDKALVDAEFVDPSNTLTFSADGPDNGGTGLSEKLRKRLHDLGVTQLFAVQTTLLPFLLPQERLKKSLYRPYDVPQDVCVSAPTGSGKTLAYVLPIIEVLSSRVVTRLRALIVLPTRDLVMQVRETFEAISRGRGLKIGTATGQNSFSHEQSQLVTDKSPGLQGGSSKVIDEADRLLAQSFQDWLAQVLSATQPSASHSGSPPLLNDSRISRHDAFAPAFHPHHLSALDGPHFVPERKESSCQKLLFSATLTRDPSKIAALNLRDPKYFIIRGKEGQSGLLDVVMEKFSMPETLTEHMIVCEASRKPLMFFYLVHMRAVVNGLVFTKSADSTTRLVRLFDFFESKRGGENPIVVRPYSSDLSAVDRKTILDKFKKQEIHILVCSDLISRGIDISHVSHVVSYDVPVDMRKYVHRVGRTARAGREGHAWSLVEEQEARYFKNMLKDAGHLEQVKKLRVSDKELVSFIPHYEWALEQLKEAYSRGEP
ncbi:P-loop containing nucleoside triphosphate hydrolase protein [Hymenopellis radicata]|nr:P-loop containing nucleoside triphosphate hydrolase protein [Hymenopellis radicata]